MKLIVAGSRDFNDYDMLTIAVRNFITAHPDIDTIVSGTARGADQLGERYAKDNNLSIDYCPADWNKYGKSAGYRRNEYMAQHADACICFWDGQSRGTTHMINLAKEYKLATLVVKFG